MAVHHRIPFHNIVFPMILLIFSAAAGCGEREQPPFFTAAVFDIWNRTLTVENFKMLYTWEERGETPFLKPYEYHARELAVEVMVTVAGDAQRVNVVTRRIPFRSLKEFSFIRGEVANIIDIRLKNNEQIVATDKFPQALKKEDTSGLADYATFVEGVIVTEGRREPYREKLYNVKKVVLIKETPNMQ